MGPVGTALPNILVVSHESATVSAVHRYLQSGPYKLESAMSIAAALQRAHGAAFDLVILELPEVGSDGLNELSEIHTALPAAALIVVSPDYDARQHAEAIRLGVTDCLTKPLAQTELQRVVRRHIVPQAASGESTQQPVDAEDVGADLSFVVAGPTMRKVRAQAEQLAGINAPVLIVGESGTGKEVTARLINKLSPRADRRFLKVNCAALPADLLESELFGYERGAFTGAHRKNLGKFELCNKGTILLDEIGEMPSTLQAKLLHVLQDKQFFRLGGETTVDVDVRILAATNVNIAQALANRKLREDLYYRLAAFMIYLPPLRERREDIPFLLQHFMTRLSHDYVRPPLQISSALMGACMSYHWPGNLRELENFVRRYLVLADEQAAVDSLHSHSNAAAGSEVAPQAESSIENVTNGHNGDRYTSCNLKSVLRSLTNETEIRIIREALEQTHWHRKRAARLLEISYRGLLNKIRQHGLKPPSAIPY